MTDLKPPREPIAVRMIDERKWWAKRLPVFALVISTAALVASTVGIYVSLRHNELSVTPLVTAWSEPDPSQPTVRWKVTNAGLGPARIRDMALFVNGQRGQGSIAEELHWKPLESVRETKPTVNWGELLVPGEGFRVGAEIEPFSLEWENRAARDSVDLDSLPVLAVCYCSLYEQCWYADSRAYMEKPKSPLIRNCSE